MGIFDKFKTILTSGSAQAVLETEGCSPQPEESRFGERPFDFENAPERWYIADRLLEQALDDPSKRDTLFLEYGIEDEDRYFALHRAWEGYQQHVIETRGEGGWLEILQRCFNAGKVDSQDRERADLMAAEGTTWEQYLEATEALSSGISVGMDPQVILRQLGMTLSDYVDAGNHWGNWFTQNAMRDPSILEKHVELSKKYRAKYAVVKNSQDFSF